VTRILLDTDICIELLRSRAPALFGRLRRRKIGSVGISVITLAELHYGVFRSRTPERNRIALARFCAPLAVHPFDRGVTPVYGRIRAALAAAGTPIGPHDLLIAAHAIALKATLVTNNEREFLRVPGLTVENWVTP
jgi:tRNA(fMet)-specific endonuclease VapC